MMAASVTSSFSFAMSRCCVVGIWGYWRRVCFWELRCAAASPKRPAPAAGDTEGADADAADADAVGAGEEHMPVVPEPSLHPPPAGAAADDRPASSPSGGAGSGRGEPGLEGATSTPGPPGDGAPVVVKWQTAPMGSKALPHRVRGKEGTNSGVGRGARGHERATVACGCLSVGRGHLLYSPWDRACVGVVQTSPHVTSGGPCVSGDDATPGTVHPTFEQCVPDVPSSQAEDALIAVSEAPLVWAPCGLALVSHGIG